MKNKAISDMDYCVVVSKKKLLGSGLDVGQFVMVIGTVSVQDKAKDPYLKRTYVTVIRVSPEGHHFMPTSDEGNHNKAVLMDPRKLSRVSEGDRRKFEKALSKQFS